MRDLHRAKQTKIKPRHNKKLPRARSGMFDPETMHPVNDVHNALRNPPKHVIQTGLLTRTDGCPQRGPRRRERKTIRAATAGPAREDAHPPKFERCLLSYTAECTYFYQLWLGRTRVHHVMILRVLRALPTPESLRSTVTCRVITTMKFSLCRRRDVSKHVTWSQRHPQFVHERPYSCRRRR